MMYLAAPYSHKDPAVVDHRMKIFCEADAVLCHAGHVTVSPLSKHFLKDYAKIPLTWVFWQEYAKKLMMRCDEMTVIMISGWDESTGVQAEIDLAKKFRIKINYFDPGIMRFVKNPN